MRMRIIYEHSYQMDDPNRERPEVKKDGVLERSITLTPRNNEDLLHYILVEGRKLK